MTLHDAKIDLKHFIKIAEVIIIYMIIMNRLAGPPVSDLLSPERSEHTKYNVYHVRNEMKSSNHLNTID